MDIVTSLAPSLFESAKTFATDHPVAAAAVGTLSAVGAGYLGYTLYRKITTPTAAAAAPAPAAIPAPAVAPAVAAPAVA